MSLKRSLLSSLSLALLTLVPIASQAQAVLKLNWGQAKPCIFTANTGGVSLDPATGALTATGTFDTTSTESSCPTSAPPPGTPSFSDSLLGDLPASVGTSATTPVGTLTWQADADNCDYTGTSYPGGVASVANWGTSTTSGAACASAGACNTAHSASITLSTDGAYTFGLRCYKNGNATPVTSSITTTASTTTTACTGAQPAGITRLSATQVTQYSPYQAPRNNVNVDTWSQVLGYDDTTDTASPWPAVNNMLQSIRITKNYYVATAFTVPASFTGYGDIKETSTNSSGAVSLTISECQGHFNSNTVTLPAKCQVNLTAEGGAKLAWTTDPASTTRCKLTQGKTYYLNIITAALSTPATSTCGSTSCTHTLVNSQVTQTP